MMEVPEGLKARMRSILDADFGNVCRLSRSSGIARETIFRVMKGRASRRTISALQDAVDRMGTGIDKALDSVYFAATPSGDRVKIGFTRGPAKRRIVSVSRECGERLTLLGVIREASLDMERDIHAAFESKRITGEWYTLDTELQEFIHANARAE